MDARLFGSSLLHGDTARAARLKGLRLVAAYCLGLALGGALGAVLENVFGRGHGPPLGLLAANFALWASVSEAQSHRRRIAFDLVALCVAASFGAMLLIASSPQLVRLGPWGPELILVLGAFLAGSLKRFGIVGAGLGSQFYIGVLLAYGYHLTRLDLPELALVAPAAAAAAILPRLFIGARHAPAIGVAPIRGASIMGLQAALAALVVVALDATLHLVEPEWAITACTYVIAGTAAGTAVRVRQRIAGTCVGVLLALACLPAAEHWAPLAWMGAAIAMVIYATALAERYDIACGAFAFTLIVTLAANGEHSLVLLTSRAWETLLGGVLGLLSARYFFPLKVNAAS